MDTLPGVTNAVLSLIQQQARIEYHPNLITPVGALPYLLQCNVQVMSCAQMAFRLAQVRPCTDIVHLRGLMHSSCATQEELLRTIEEAGFETRLLGSGDDSTTRLSIGGMTCGSCSSAIESALKGTDGVRGVSVSLITSTAEVGSTSPTVQTAAGALHA